MLLLAGRGVDRVMSMSSRAAALALAVASCAGLSVRPRAVPRESPALDSGMRRVAVVERPAQVPGIYFAATPQPVVEAMLKLARVAADDVVYDLGSGDGRIVVIAAQLFGARGVGVELRSDLVAISRQVALEGDVADRVTFVEGDLFTTDISGATVVTMWLSESLNMRLQPKLKRELRPGTRIVSRQFRIGDWAPERIVRAGNDDLFLWTIPR
jgi:SAM-dependent methyltransferase